MCRIVYCKNINLWKGICVATLIGFTRGMGRDHQSKLSRLPVNLNPVVIEFTQPVVATTWLGDGFCSFVSVP